MSLAFVAPSVASAQEDTTTTTVEEVVLDDESTDTTTTTVVETQPTIESIDGPATVTPPVEIEPESCISQSGGIEIFEFEYADVERDSMAWGTMSQSFYPCQPVTFQVPTTQVPVTVPVTSPVYVEVATAVPQQQVASTSTVPDVDILKFISILINAIVLAF